MIKRKEEQQKRDWRKGRESEKRGTTETGEQQKKVGEIKQYEAIAKERGKKNKKEKKYENGGRKVAEERKKRK